MIAARPIAAHRPPPSRQRHSSSKPSQAVATQRALALRSGVATVAVVAAAASRRPRTVVRAMASSVFRYQQQQAPPPDGEQDARQYAAAASRNEAPILEALAARLKAPEEEGGAAGNDDKESSGGGRGGGALLEVACGTGQHSAAFSRALVGPGKPLSAYVPTDLTDGLFASVRAHAAAPGVPPGAVLPPRVLDVSLPPERWFAADSRPPPPPLPLRAVLAVNLAHISPWGATLGLLRGAAHLLDPPRGRLFLYGPFTRRGGEHVGTGDGNARFDASLRAQDPAWGYRDVDAEVVPAAEAAGLALEEAAEMPANNLLLVFRKKKE